ncbi:MAG TPA: hypothetical protein EYP56_21805, partial [Planctomycetaceae bacterium]|nr:hypothetical protein [Planctomycetaceae bacterium]
MSGELAGQSRLSEVVEEDVIQYRPVSASAIVGLITGLLSPLAFFHPGLWTMPVAGLFFSGLALVRITRGDVPVIGRRAAVVGLVLSTTMIAAAPAQWLSYRWLIGREA